MKKLITLFLTAVLAFTLSACNSGNPAIGDTIKLGGIDWLVISIQDGKALLLSDKILERREYHSTKADVTWEHSSLRKYLNGTFYDSTFSNKQKERIAETTVINNDNPKGRHGPIPAGNDTTDKIFLLSIDEANKYLAGGMAWLAYYEPDGKAISWWLRSPGGFSDYAALVNNGYMDNDGNFVDYVGMGVDGGGVVVYGVRPALWLNL